MLFTKNSDDDDSSLAISDLMTALMGTFLIGSVVAIELKSKHDAEPLANNTLKKIEDNANIPKARENTFQSHFSEVAGKFKQLDLDVKQLNLKNRFQFESGKSAVTDDMATMLDTLCPIMIDYGHKAPDLQRVIFRGHTDKSWTGKGNDFIGNMEVSYMRAINTLKYCLKDFEPGETKLASKFIAQGHSFTSSLNKVTHANDRKARFVEIIFEFKGD